VETDTLEYYFDFLTQTPNMVINDNLELMFRRSSKSPQKAQNQWSSFFIFFYPQLLTLIHTSIKNQFKILIINIL